MISTKIQDPCPDYHIIVHDSHKTDPDTGLYEPCVVKCNWFQDVEHRRVIRGIGAMPGERLEAIMNMINALLDDEDFADWVGDE